MRLAALAVSFVLAFSGLAAAQTYDTPEALIEAFYAPYLAGSENFDSKAFDDQPAMRSAALQGLYDQDAADTPAGDQGTLDFDPYIGGQDWTITDFAMYGFSGAILTNTAPHKRAIAAAGARRCFAKRIAPTYRPTPSGIPSIAPGVSHSEASLALNKPAAATVLSNTAAEISSRNGTAALFPARASAEMNNPMPARLNAVTPVSIQR